MINIQLEVAEVEAVLKKLAEGAYNEVAGLIAKIHGQALPQVPKPTEPVIVEEQSAE